MNLPIKTSFIISVFIMGLFSCTEPQSDIRSSALTNYLIEQGVSNPQQLNSIFIMTEEGCHKCAQSYALFLSDKTELEKSLIIVTAQGNVVDVSAFTESEKVLFDFDKEILGLGLCEGSAAIFLGQGSIDTLIEINPTSLTGSLEYISSRIDT